MHKYIIVRVFSHKTKEMTLSPMTETKSPNSALECFPKFSQKCRACVKIFLVGWEFISPKYMILYVNVVVLFTRCDFIDELPLKKGNMLCKIQPGSGLFTNLSILHCIDFLPQWKKNKQTKHYERKKFVWQGRMNSSTCSRHFSPQSRLFLVPAKMYPYVDPLIDL